MPLGMEIGLGPSHIVLDGGLAPQFSAHVCGKTAGWLKMPLNWYGDKPHSRRHCIGWGPRPPSPSAKRCGGTADPSTFPSMSIVAKLRWMDQDATWHGGRPRPGHIVLDGDPAAPPERGTPAPPPTFRLTSIVAKRSPISATA